MDPTGFQCSINDPFNDKAGGSHRPPLPRSFKPARHGMQACGPFPGLLIAHRGSNTPGYEKRAYEAFEGFSRGLLTFVWVLPIIRGNQTGLCRIGWFSCEILLCRKWFGQVLQGWWVRSEKNFLFVSQREAKMRGKKSILRGVLLT